MPFSRLLLYRHLPMRTPRASTPHQKQRSAMKHIEIVNGPNLNLTGKREPAIYGNTTMEEMVDALRRRFPNVEIGYFQSNVEGEIINRLHEVGFSAQGII